MSPDLPPLLPHGTLAKVLPDVFVVQGQTRPVFGGRQLQFSRTMTVVRENGALTLVNTLRLDDAGLEALEARNLVKLGSFHGRDDAFYVQRYGARMWALPGMPHSRGIRTDHVLEAGAPGPTADAETFAYATPSAPEGRLLLARHGGILLACDSLQNGVVDAYFDEATAAMMTQQGLVGRVSVGPGWRAAGRPTPADLGRVLSLEFRHLISAHGPALLHTAHDAVHAALAR